jgi:hypothetical protein
MARCIPGLDDDPVDREQDDYASQKDSDRFPFDVRMPEMPKRLHQQDE